MNQRSWIEIDLQKFCNNLEEIKKILPSGHQFLQVVKADAYGHGAYQISKKAIEHGAVMLGVANAEEGFYLRYQQINHPILILSPSLVHEIDLIIDNYLIPTVSDIDFCINLNTKLSEKGLKTPFPVHIKIDTGMNRNGLKVNQLEEFYNIFSNLNNLCIEGIFSHFAASDDDEDFCLEQYSLFTSIVNLFKSNKYIKINHSLKYVHISNSAGLFLQPEYCEITNLVRLGLMS